MSMHKLRNLKELALVYAEHILDISLTKSWCGHAAEGHTIYESCLGGNKGTLVQEECLPAAPKLYEEKVRPLRANAHYLSQVKL